MGSSIALCAVVAIVGCGVSGPGSGGDDNDDDDGSSGNGGSGPSSGSGGGSSANGSGSGTGSGTGGGSSGGSIAVLGGGTHGMGAVTVDEIATSADGLATPRDLAFHPVNAGQLWIVNRADESVVVVSAADSEAPSSEKFDGAASEHFLAEPSALAFNSGGDFASIHESDDPTQGGSTPGDFMGPTLWTTDPQYFDAGDVGHIDMLHNSPNGMGIAWESGNVFWVFDGYHAAISRYDFGQDHGPGGTDHADGEMVRYVEGQVARVPDVPSHMELSGTLLYIADTGNSRVAVLDTTTGSPGGTIQPNYDGGTQYAMTGASLTTLVDGGAMGMTRPSGLAIHEGILFVSDNQSSTIYGFTMAGELIDWLDTGYPPGSLMGLAFDADGRLYVADAVGDRVMRFAASAGGSD